MGDAAHLEVLLGVFHPDGQKMASGAKMRPYGRISSVLKRVGRKTADPQMAMEALMSGVLEGFVAQGRERTVAYQEAETQGEDLFLADQLRNNEDEVDCRRLRPTKAESIK